MDLALNLSWPLIQVVLWPILEGTHCDKKTSTHREVFETNKNWANMAIPYVGVGPMEVIVTS